MTPPQPKSTTNRILIIGASGLLGQGVARQLRTEGWTVRVMGRTEEKLRQLFTDPFERVPGDAEREVDLVRAVAGCQAVHVSVANIPDWHLERRVLEMLLPIAERAGVQRIGYVSGASVHPDRSDFAMIAAKVRCEALLQESPLETLIFRPTMFFETLPMMVRDGKAMVFGQQPQAAHFLSTADFSRMVAKAFGLPPAANRVFHIRGPQALTLDEALQQYCQVTHTDATIKHIPFWMMSLIAFFKGDPLLKGVVQMMRYFEGKSELGDRSEADQLLGPATETLESVYGAKSIVPTRVGGSPMKSWRFFLPLSFAAVVMGSAALLGCGLTKEHREARSLSIAAIDFSQLRDGTYTGRYAGGMYGWRANRVRVSIISGKVADIRLAHSAEFPTDHPDFRGLAERILAAQSLQVDAITAATLTTKAHLKSIEDALQQAQLPLDDTNLPAVH